MVISFHQRHFTHSGIWSSLIKFLDSLSLSCHCNLNCFCIFLSGIRVPIWAKRYRHIDHSLIWSKKTLLKVKKKSTELKLVRTLLNYRVLGCSTDAIFLSNDQSVYAPIFIGWTSGLVSFVWDQSTCQVLVESNKIQIEKFLPTVGLKPTTLRFEVWWSTDWATQACWKLFIFCLWPYYIHVLPIPICTLL